jgi:exopolyphosphatase/guanosine-5'-triphosphate,3'-diphosphate pyrophosphatase
MRAVVDIGSNSIKFAIDRNPENALRELETRSWVTRLGRQMGQTGLLSIESLADSARALEEISSRFTEIGLSSSQVRAFATAAVRECKNPETIQELVQKSLGVELKILTGIEEAQYSMIGARAASDLLLKGQPRLFVDVGGASTEVGVMEPQIMAHSFPAGAVRCHESLGMNQMPLSDEVWRAAQSKLRAVFDIGWRLAPYCSKGRGCQDRGRLWLSAAKPDTKKLQ